MVWKHWYSRTTRIQIARFFFLLMYHNYYIIAKKIWHARIGYPAVHMLRNNSVDFIIEIDVGQWLENLRVVWKLEKRKIGFTIYLNFLRLLRKTVYLPFFKGHLVKGNLFYLHKIEYVTLHLFTCVLRCTNVM